MKSLSPKVYSKINYFTVAPLWYDIISKKGKEMTLCQDDRSDRVVTLLVPNLQTVCIVKNISD